MRTGIPPCALLGIKVRDLVSLSPAVDHPMGEMGYLHGHPRAHGHAHPAQTCGARTHAHICSAPCPAITLRQLTLPWQITALCQLTAPALVTAQHRVTAVPSHHTTVSPRAVPGHPSMPGYRNVPARRTVSAHCTTPGHCATHGHCVVPGHYAMTRPICPSVPSPSLGLVWVNSSPGPLPDVLGLCPAHHYEALQQVQGTAWGWCTPVPHPTPSHCAILTHPSVPSCPPSQSAILLPSQGAILSLSQCPILTPLSMPSHPYSTAPSCPPSQRAILPPSHCAILSPPQSATSCPHPYVPSCPMCVPSYPIPLCHHVPIPLCHPDPHPFLAACPGISSEHLTLKSRPSTLPWYPTPAPHPSPPPQPHQPPP